MAFSLDDLDGAEVWKDAEPKKGKKFRILIAIVNQEEQETIFEKGSDLETCKALMKGVTGFKDKDKNEMPFDDAFFTDINTFPALVSYLAHECWKAQQDGLIKN